MQDELKRMDNGDAEFISVDEMNRQAKVRINPSFSAKLFQQVDLLLKTNLRLRLNFIMI